MIRIAPDGKLFWHGREVETDDNFRAAMLELAEALSGRSLRPEGREQELSAEAIADAADAFRTTLLQKADAHTPHAGKYPLWHGWALYDAFVAGAKFRARGPQEGSRND